ncbi:MAG: hypothetical protein CL600_01130 [Alteromonas sp.]|uniref:hypothetical protein n=1 Tax=Alteromonas sp. MB-3u-76 TaxID=2058133 RepID=UPI000C304E6B|nr:hypothetical protein [Alteromonas sp. MB-3u-76]AUC89749.1 hypothetical protein CW735_17470 [Alteromonas sp. MB-3u-76]MAI63479.1 hypothetical protein [Alteromonas sp.]
MKDQQQAVTLAENQLFAVSGGNSLQTIKESLSSRPIPGAPITGSPTPKEPIYITMAIGEGGGTLPDILA